MFKIRFYLLPLFILLFINCFSQKTKNNIKTQCKKEYDSIFSKEFGEKFYKKNIKYNDTKSFIDIYLTNDLNSDDNYERVFLNFKNDDNIDRYRKKYSPLYSSDFYVYDFLYKELPFYETIYTCEFVNKEDFLKYEKKHILEYYNRIKSKEFISPRKALKIATSQGYKNICSLSLTDASFHNKNKTVWQLMDCGDEKEIKILELNPIDGKILIKYGRNYEKTEKASYWNIAPSHEQR